MHELFLLSNFELSPLLVIESNGELLALPLLLDVICYQFDQSAQVPH